MARPEERISVKYLCEVAKVSKSGYYSWLKNRDIVTARLEKEYVDYLLIKGEFNTSKKGIGWRTIKMNLEGNKGIIMNHKKIRRIMKKYSLITQNRRSNPYKKMAKATKEHRTCSNLLNRCFKQGKPLAVLLTDITYLHYGNGLKAYLSAVKDGQDNEIVSYHVSSGLTMDIVMDTLVKLELNLGIDALKDSIIHSDQGFHYTNPLFQEEASKLGMIQSMSRRGNCWDNAPMESFFGHFKDEVDYEGCKTLEELKVVIDKYIYHYNHNRYQWNLNKMTPIQYRDHLLAA